LSMKKFTFAALIIFSMTLVSCATAPVAPPVSPAVPAQAKKAKVAVVLGAGAARGFAHIGVLKVLEANGVPVNMVVGTSAGSFVGSLYAGGYSAFQIQKMALDLEKADIADYTIPDNGFIKGDLLVSFVNKALRNQPLEKLKIPFFAVATDIQTGEEMVFGRGNAGKAVRASCSIPGVFRPATINGRMYVDGGVVSPIAVDAARKFGADIVVAVDISSDLDRTQPGSTIDTILQSVNIMYSKISASQTPHADIVIRPKVGYIGSSDFESRHEAIMEGEKAAMEAMPKIKAILDKLRR
jgi:NTE family protein